jgi:ABC-2 type transport system permease protein
MIGFLLTAAVGYTVPPASSPVRLRSTAAGGVHNHFRGHIDGHLPWSDAISGEFQNKTRYFRIPNPIRRSSIYGGKWLGAFIASTVILAVFTAITLGNGFYYFGANVPVQFFQSVLFTWIYMISVLGFPFLFSAVFKSSAISILETVILFSLASTS